MKKFEKFQPINTTKQHNTPFFSLLNSTTLLNLLPQILQFLPKLTQNLKNNEPKQQVFAQTSTALHSENRQFALKALENHNKNVNKLKNKKA